MNNDDDKPLKTKYLKLWLISVVLFSCVMILVYFCINKLYPKIYREQFLDFKIRSSVLPDYPPPLTNFID
jgi:hypothetical protein